MRSSLLLMNSICYLVLPDATPHRTTQYSRIYTRSPYVECTASGRKTFDLLSKLLWAAVGGTLSGCPWIRDFDDLIQENALVVAGLLSELLVMVLLCCFFLFFSKTPFRVLLLKTTYWSKHCGSNCHRIAWSMM